MNPFRKNKKQLSLFITAGFPHLNSLPGQIQSLEKNGVDFIEVGIPFSDPMADGETIQTSSDVALKNGMNIPLLFEQLSEVKATIPLVIMSYFNPILQFGLEPFLQECKRVNIHHLIVPDISLEIYDQRYRSLFEQHGITLCFLATPATSSVRIARMTELSKNGFLYLISSSMTTGKSVQMVQESEVERIRSAANNIPVMIGFGIKSKADVKEVHHLADGAIIGSAYIQAIQENREQAFISGLLAPEPQNL